MAALPPQITNDAHKSGDQKPHGPTSHGRGGAGNISATKTDTTPPDPSAFETPTIKSKIYTTGRGGTGNMAKNESAEEARRAQDVVGTPRRDSSNLAQHIGRGGGGNVFKPSKEDLEHARNEQAKGKGGDSAIADDEHVKSKSLAEKAREFLGLK